MIVLSFGYVSSSESVRSDRVIRRTRAASALAPARPGTRGFESGGVALRASAASDYAVG